MIPLRGYGENASGDEMKAKRNIVQLALATDRKKPRPLKSVVMAQEIIANPMVLEYPKVKLFSHYLQSEFLWTIVLLPMTIGPATMRP
jgi:hypothetical protein